ncbi:MAG: FAD binding domain-containing protein [Saprospiraceae bacterium]
MTPVNSYLRPATAEQAVQMASGCTSGFRFLAGGTDVWVNKFQGVDTNPCLIDLTGIGEMSQIRMEDGQLVIGALLCLEDIWQYPAIRTECPVLAEAALAVASPVIRKTATLGGNLMCENRCVFYNQSEWWREAVGYCLKCNGDICIATGGKKNCFSKFVSDTAVALISLGAKVNLTSQSGSYTLNVEDLYSGDGVYPHAKDPASLICSVSVPLGQGFRSSFRKLRQRQTLDFSSLTTAVTIGGDEKIRIVLGGVDPKPVLVEGSPADHPDALIKQAVKKARIVDNDVYPRLYRKEMIRVFLEKSLRELSLY